MRTPSERVFFFLFFSAGFAITTGHAQEKEPISWRKFNPPPAPVLSPEEAISSFRLPPGFRIELVAAEPLIEDPATAVWDADGRLWVAEMRGYMHTATGDNENAGNDRIVVLQDDDGDGKMDRSTPFLKGLVMPRAICHVEGGVLIGEPPFLWFCQDLDGDLVCDKKTKIYDSYGQRDAVSRTASGLVLALDNWIHNSRHPVKFQFRQGKLFSQPDAYRGDFGVSQDDEGRIFSNVNASWLHADLASPAWFLRHPGLLKPSAIYRKIVRGRNVYGIRVNTGVNSGQVPGELRADGRLARPTAATWPGIFRGDGFPAPFEGNAFVPEPAGNVVARFSLTSEDGIEISSNQGLVPDEKWGKREFLASTDERFRPVQCATGPDGCLYVTDFYRGIIEYKLFVRPFLAEQIAARKLDQPLGLGRIYRIVHQSKSPQPIPRLSKLDSAGLVKNLTHPNGWRRDTAQRLLVERADSASVSLLKNLATDTRKKPLGRIHALWTLEGIGAIDWAFLKKAFADPDSRVRVAAIRISASLPEKPEAIPLLIALADDSSPAAVQLHVLLRLGDFSDDPEAHQTMAVILNRHGGNILFREAAISGLAGKEALFLRETSPRPSENFIRELVTAACRDGDPSTVSDLLKLVESETGSQKSRIAILDGMGRGLPARKLVHLPKRPDALEKILSGSEAPFLKLGKIVAARTTWPGDKKIKPTTPTIRPLTKTEREQFQLGRQLYRETCMPCHQIHGKGMASLAPPLISSPWVTGSEQRLIRIGLHGMHGPLVLNGTEWNLVMPGQSVNPRMTDHNLAAVFTYIRREWGHTADPVKSETISVIRAATKDRILPWTVEELQKIP